MTSEHRTLAAAALISPLLLLLALTLSATWGGPAGADTAAVDTPGSVLPAPTSMEPLPTAAPAQVRAQQAREGLADTGFSLALPILIGTGTLLVCVGVIVLVDRRFAARFAALDRADPADLD